MADGNVALKKCTRCGKEFPITREFFHLVAAKRRDPEDVDARCNFVAYCKRCANEMSKLQYKKRRETFNCRIDGCTSGVHSMKHRLCCAHLRRLRMYGDPLEKSDSAKKRGKGYVDPKGYVRITHKRDGKWESARMKHRLVMEVKLGRRLLPSENVHHINGVRTDNRPENLELWVKTQPCGQRPADLVKWAREIIALYGAEVERLEKTFQL